MTHSCCGLSACYVQGRDTWCSVLEETEQPSGLRLWSKPMGLDLDDTQAGGLGSGSSFLLIHSPSLKVELCCISQDLTLQTCHSFRCVFTSPSLPHSCLWPSSSKGCECKDPFLLSDTFRSICLPTGVCVGTFPENLGTD